MSRFIYRMKAEVGSLNVEDLTPGRIVYIGGDGELIDSANLRFSRGPT